MTTDHDTLHDELHELADGLAPNAATARHRARRAVIQRAHRRRAMVGTAFSTLGVAVAVALVAGTIALARHSDTVTDGRGPVATSGAPTSTARTIATSSPPPSTTNAPPSTIRTTVPDWTTIPSAASAYAQIYPWGRADDQVAFSTPQGEGASGGPSAFTADPAGDVVMLDHSNARIVRRDHGAASISEITGLTPAVTAAVFDAQGRAIVASVDAVSVYGPDGQPEGSWPHITDDPHGIYSLEVDGATVYWRHGGFYTAQGDATRTPLLHDDGSGYVAATDTAAAADEITGRIDANLTTLHVTATGRDYEITTGDTDVRAARAFADGSFVFVLGRQQHGVGGPELDAYVVGYVDPAGGASYSTFTAPMGYLVNGPVFEINDDGLGVMSSTISGGVTVSYYAYS